MLVQQKKRKTELFKKFLVHLLGFFLLTLLPLIAQQRGDYKFTISSGKNFTLLKLTSIYERDYLAIALPNTFDNYFFELNLKNYKFTFFVGSFFFAFEDLGESKKFYLQMTHPTFIFRNELYIPFQSLIISLNSLPNYSLEIGSNSLVIKKETNLVEKKPPPKNKTQKKEQAIPKVRKTPAVSQDNTSSPTKFELPKINFSVYERFAIKPEPPNNTIVNFMLHDSTKLFPKFIDTTIYIPPKYYVLPPHLKNDPK